MGILELFILAAGLSVDSFAVSVSTGLANRKIQFIQAFKVAVILGFIQGIAPIIGGFLGLGVRSLVESLDHWIALVLLLIVGCKMIYDGLKPGTSKSGEGFPKFSAVVTMGIATSIDALVVGITLGLVGVNLFHAGVIIGVITGVSVMLGLLVGARFIGFSKARLEILAGIVLIGLGVKIFVEHTLTGI